MVMIKKFQYLQDELNAGSVRVTGMPSTAFLVDHNSIYSGYVALLSQYSKQYLERKSKIIEPEMRKAGL